MGIIDDKRTVSLAEKPVKPRRTRGTPAQRARNKFAAAFLVGGSLIGLIYMYLPTTNKIEKLIENIFPQSPPLGERAPKLHSMDFVGAKKSSVDVEKLLEELGRNPYSGNSTSEADLVGSEASSKQR